jgi:hypothetical protein
MSEPEKGYPYAKEKRVQATAYCIPTSTISR